MLVIALGDLHSNLKTLDWLKSVQALYPKAITVFLGDYIDTYHNNSGFALLEAIKQMQEADPDTVRVLIGNHEDEALKFLADVAQSDWLACGGLETLIAEGKRFGLTQKGNDLIAREQLALEARNLILSQKPELIAWMKALPLTLTIGKLAFVHAGLDQQASDPITESSRSDCLWLRYGYFYDQHLDHVFAHNDFGFTVISGHTPTGKIAGRYQNKTRPEKFADSRNPIYAIQYPDELPRYLMDGGVGGQDSRLLGNIGVFDSETGLLVDAYED